MDQSSAIAFVREGRTAANVIDFSLREAHHRIANDLAVIASMTRLQAQALDPGARLTRAQAKTMLSEAASRIDAVGRLHRTLCSPGDDSLVADFLKALCKDVASFAGVPGSHVKCRVELGANYSGELVRALGLLVHELVLNALKYAHPSGVPVRVDIWCREENGALALDVADDGVGFPEGFDPERDGGFGLRMSHELAAQLGARLKFHSTALGLLCRVRGQP